jgi:hypothetical protein
VYPVPGADGGEQWYLIRCGRVLAALSRPTTAVEARTARKTIASTFDRPELAVAPVEQVDHVLLVAAWFRKRPEERVKALSPEAATAQIRTVAEPSPAR